MRTESRVILNLIRGQIKSRVDAGSHQAKISRENVESVFQRRGLSDRCGAFYLLMAGDSVRAADTALWKRNQRKRPRRPSYRCGREMETAFLRPNKLEAKIMLPVL